MSASGGPAARAAAAGNAAPAPAPVLSEQQKATMLSSVSISQNKVLLESDLDTSELREKLIVLRQSYSILLTGNMGAGPNTTVTSACACHDRASCH
jgi:hypothetical protein